MKTVASQRKELRILGAYTLLSVLIFAFSAWVFSLILWRWLGLVLGTALCIVSLVIVVRARREPDEKRIFPIVMLNSIASGASVSAYYLCKGILLPFRDAMLAVLPAFLGCVCVLLLLTLLRRFPRLSAVLCTVLMTASAVLFVVLWVRKGVSPFGMCFFMMTTPLALIIGGYGTLHKSDETAFPGAAGAAITSFGLFLLATFIVLVILSEGDALELFVGSADPDNSERKLPNQ